jgi:hypothetical protein
MALFTRAIASRRVGLRWKLLEGHDEIATVGLRVLKALCHDGKAIDHRGLKWTPFFGPKGTESKERFAA